LGTVPAGVLPGDRGLLTIDGMGDDEETAASRAQQPGHTAYEVTTGEELDDHAATFEIEIRPGEGVDTVRVRIPGMDEFVTGSQQLRDWLREHGLVRTPQQWSEVERKLTEALMGRGQRPHGNHPGAGSYQWDDYRHNGPGMTDADREQVNEMQSEDWTRMLNAWDQFHQQIQDLRSIADGSGEEIVRQVVHTITALNMVENSDWSGIYSTEFAEWERLSTDGLGPETLHAAARAIVEAGETLHHQWHETVSAGNYDYHTLLQAQHDFIKHCEDARKAMVF
jgi:hypothetical protein